MTRTQRSGRTLENTLMDPVCKRENCVGGTRWTHTYVLVVALPGMTYFERL